jgi:translation initiation factor 1 (eIF-1/SUI1)
MLTLTPAGKVAGKEPKVKGKAPEQKYIHITKTTRNKRKFITGIKGIETFGITPKYTIQALL